MSMATITAIENEATHIRRMRDGFPLWSFKTPRWEADWDGDFSVDIRREGYCIENCRSVIQSHNVDSAFRLSCCTLDLDTSNR